MSPRKAKNPADFFEKGSKAQVDTKELQRQQEELIAALPADFYKSDFDPVSFTFQRIEAFSEEAINKERRQQEKTLDAVNARLTHLVTEASDSFGTTMAMT